MDLKSSVIMETKKNDRLYQFVMPVGAPYGEVYDVAFEILTTIVDLAKKAAEEAKPKEASAEKVAETEIAQ